MMFCVYLHCFRFGLVSCLLRSFIRLGFYLPLVAVGVVDASAVDEVSVWVTWPERPYPSRR